MKFHHKNLRIIEILLLGLICINTAFANPTLLPAHCWVPCILTDSNRILNIIEEQEILLKTLYHMGFKKEFALNTIINRDTFVVSKNDLDYLSKKNFHPSRRIDSLFQIKPDTFLSQSVNGKRFIKTPSDYSYEEECYYLSILFDNHLFFYRDCESGYFVEIKLDITSSVQNSFYRAYGNRDPFMQEGGLNGSMPTVDIEGEKREELFYRGEAVLMDAVSVLDKRDMLYDAILSNAKINGPDKEAFYCHSDHLGSANWITESTGKPIQYMQYAPFGELLINETEYGYDEQYKFTGKERDAETGYDYFGARYYSYALGGHWLSVDPMSDKYPHITPYAYCNWNPVKFVDKELS